MKIGILIALRQKEEVYNNIKTAVDQGFDNGQISVWDMSLYCDEVVQQVKQACKDFSFTVTYSIPSVVTPFIPEDEEISSMTVSGLVQEATSRLPKVGDRFTIDRYDGEVTRVAHRRVMEVRLRENAVHKDDKDD